MHQKNVQQARQDFIDIPYWKGIVRAVLLHHPFGAGPIPVPDFHCPIPLTTEHDEFTVFAPRHQRQYRFRLSETGKVEKITVLTVGVFGVATAGAQGRSGNDGDGVGLHHGHELLTAFGKFFFGDTHVETISHNGEQERFGIHHQ